MPLIEIEYDWPTYKTYIDGTIKTLRNQYIESTQQYLIFALDLNIKYVSVIHKAGFEPVGWTQQQIDDNTTWRTDFEDNYQDDSNQRVGETLTPTEKSNLELESTFVAARANYFQKLTYTDGILTKLEIFEDNTETVKLFTKDFTYVDGLLTQLILTRHSDDATLTKSFSYTGDQLSSFTEETS